MGDFVTVEQWQAARVEDRVLMREIAESVVAGAAVAQEQRWVAIKDDLRATVTLAVSDGLKGIEARVNSTEGIVRVLQQDMYGDPTQRSGNPSLFERLDTFEAAFERKTDELAVLINGQDVRIQKYERYEKLAVQAVRAGANLAQIVLKGRAAMFIKSFIALVLTALPWVGGIVALIATAIARFS
jgi:hypothetical protein